MNVKLTLSHSSEPLKLHSNDTLINEHVHPARPHQPNMNNTVLMKITDIWCRHWIYTGCHRNANAILSDCDQPWVKSLGKALKMFTYRKEEKKKSLTHTTQHILMVMSRVRKIKREPSSTLCAVSCSPVIFSLTAKDGRKEKSGCCGGFCVLRDDVWLSRSRFFWEPSHGHGG